MPDEYISREAAVKAANEWVNEACMAPAMRMSRLLDKLAKVPAADVAEVVRYRYCAHLGAPISGGCYDCKKYMMPYCRPYDFCSHGERKEDSPCES